MVGRTGANVADEDLLSAGSSPGVYTKTQWQAETVGHTDHPGQSYTDGGGSDFWNRSSRPICHRSNTPIGHSAARWMRCVKCIAGSIRDCA